MMIMRHVSVFALLSFLTILMFIVVTQIHYKLLLPEGVGGGGDTTLSQHFLEPFLESSSQQQMVDPSRKQQQQQQQQQSSTSNSRDHSDNNNNNNYYYRPPKIPDHVKSFDDLLPPIQVIEEYKKYHSVDVLRREEQSKSNNANHNNRTYVVGFYQCPLAAGNRLHEFVNHLLWAILTNRTFLWKYWDDQTCLKYAPDKLIELHTCEKATTSEASKKTCDTMLHLAPWIPSYDEFSTTTSLPQPIVVPAMVTLPTPTYRAIERGRKPIVVDTQYGQSQNPKVLIFMRYQNRLSYLGDSKIRNLKLHTTWGRQSAERLFKLGEEFLYGLLFRTSFDFTYPIRQSITKALVLPTTNTNRNYLDDMYTVALHSRHNESEDTGCNIVNEQGCLKEFLVKKWGNNKKHKIPCQIAVMSDRECTITRLQKWLEGDGPYHCQVRVAPHETGTGTFEEHGPFAGAGFFQDLIYASSITRNGVIGSLEDPGRYGEAWRSSSSMLLELVDYERKMEAWGRGLDPSNMPNLDLCTIQLPTTS